MDYTTTNTSIEQLIIHMENVIKLVNSYIHKQKLISGGLKA